MSLRLWLTHRERKAQGERDDQQRAQEAVALVRAYRSTFEGGGPGTVVLAHLLRSVRLMGRTYEPGQDAATTAFHEGRRSVGLEIIEMLNRDPEAILKMATTGEVANLYEDTP